MHENRTKYPKKKAQMYQLLQDLPKKYSVTALVRMEKVRASQLLPLRKKLQGEVEILSIKDKVAQRSLEKLDIPGIEKMKEKLTGQCVFMFTNMSPFKLNVLLAKNKILLTARGGDIASMDDTDLAANANAVTAAIEKTLPNGSKNIKKIMFKTTMGKAIKVEQVKK